MLTLNRNFIALVTKCYHVGFKQHKWCLSQATEIRSIYADDSNVSIGSLVRENTTRYLANQNKKIWKFDIASLHSAPIHLKYVQSSETWYCSKQQHLMGRSQQVFHPENPILLRIGLFVPKKPSAAAISVWTMTGCFRRQNQVTGHMTWYSGLNKQIKSTSSAILCIFSRYQEY